MDALPFVVDVYRRDLTIEHYVIGYLLHPYVSLYTGRGCRSKCTFCLWPQTVGGHRYRVRSPASVEAEMARAKRYFPQVREFFFDDDTFTDDLPRAEEIARRLGRLGITWSCNAKANVPRRTLEILRDNGLRLLLVGYESGNQRILNNIKKGLRLDVARQFTRDAKSLGITIHGTFILGLPGETHETIQETVRFACEIEPDTIQVSLAAPYPGTALHREAQERGWLSRTDEDLVNRDGVQTAALEYPGLAQAEIFDFGRDLLPSLLLPSPEDHCDRRRDAAGSGGHAAAAPGGSGVLPVPAGAAGQSGRRAGGRLERRRLIGGPLARSVRLSWQYLSEPGGRADLSGPQLERCPAGAITRRGRPASIPIPGGARSPDGMWSGPT